MTKSIFWLLLILLIPLSAFSRTWPKIGENTDHELQSKLEALTRDFRGDVGVYVRHLSSGRTAAIRVDELFPTASMIKVPILLALFERFENGGLDYRSELVYRDSLLYAGSGILGSFRMARRSRLAKSSC